MVKHMIRDTAGDRAPILEVFRELYSNVPNEGTQATQWNSEAARGIQRGYLHQKKRCKSTG